MMQERRYLAAALWDSGARWERSERKGRRAVCQFRPNERAGRVRAARMDGTVKSNSRDQYLWKWCGVVEERTWKSVGDQGASLVRSTMQWSRSHAKQQKESSKAIRLHNRTPTRDSTSTLLEILNHIVNVVAARTRPFDLKS